MTSSGLCVGSTDKMVFSPKINGIVAIMRRAWYFKGDSCMYCYLTKRAHVSKGDLVLGNHEDPNKTIWSYFRFNNDIGWNNRVTQRMIDVGKCFDINLKRLKEWGAS
eukprot:7628157-Ditylum_brightwellii.AAC.1